jgi:drug/metabolite transporter (DMT)-like permease
MLPGGRIESRAALHVITKPRARRLIYVTAFAAIYICWGTSFLATRVAVQIVPPFLFGSLRFCVAGGLMLVLASAMQQRVTPLGREWRDLSVLALLGFVISNGSNVWALQTVHSNQSALLSTTAPCWITLLGAFGARAHRPQPRAMVGLALGFLGAGLLLLPTAEGPYGAALPQLLVVMGCFAWAVSTIYLRGVGTQLPVFSLIGWQMLLGGLGLGALGMATGEPQHWHWSWSSILPLVYLIVFGSCISHTAYVWLAQRVTPASLGTYAYVNPIIATLLGWLVLDEHLEWIQLLGMVVALLGVLLINWPSRAARAQRVV